MTLNVFMVFKEVQDVYMSAFPDIESSFLCVWVYVQELQQRLGVMECELLSCRETARGQERTIQTLSDSLSTKDNEVCSPP